MVFQPRSFISPLDITHSSGAEEPSITLVVVASAKKQTIIGDLDHLA